MKWNEGCVDAGVVAAEDDEDVLALSLMSGTNGSLGVSRRIRRVCFAAAALRGRLRPPGYDRVRVS